MQITVVCNLILKKKLFNKEKWFIYQGMYHELLCQTDLHD